MGDNSTLESITAALQEETGEEIVLSQEELLSIINDLQEVKNQDVATARRLTSQILIGILPRTGAVLKTAVTGSLDDGYVAPLEWKSLRNRITPLLPKFDEALSQVVEREVNQIHRELE